MDWPTLSISGRLQQRNCQAQDALANCSMKSSTAAPPSALGASASGASPRPPSGNEVSGGRTLFPSPQPAPDMERTATHTRANIDAAAPGGRDALAHNPDRRGCL